jgi:hypothetical protein
MGKANLDRGADDKFTVRDAFSAVNGATGLLLFSARGVTCAKTNGIAFSRGPTGERGDFSAPLNFSLPARNLSSGVVFLVIEPSLK